MDDATHVVQARPVIKAAAHPSTLRQFQSLWRHPQYMKNENAIFGANIPVFGGEDGALLKWARH